MSEITSFSDYASKYNSNIDFTALLGSTSDTASVGITISKENKLELNEDALKKADISSLKIVFTGYNSFANKISQKATGISSAANRAAATYTSSGAYSNTLFSLVSSKINEEV